MRQNGLRADSQTEQMKPLRKHDNVRKNKAESVKLKRIELELMESKQLKQVEHDDDAKEFEGVTNNEFNRNMENELRLSDDIRLVGL